MHTYCQSCHLTYCQSVCQFVPTYRWEKPSEMEKLGSKSSRELKFTRSVCARQPMPKPESPKMKNGMEEKITVKSKTVEDCWQNHAYIRKLEVCTSSQMKLFDPKHNQKSNNHLSSKWMVFSLHLLRMPCPFERLQYTIHQMLEKFEIDKK